MKRKFILTCLCFFTISIAYHIQAQGFTSLSAQKMFDDFTNPVSPQYDYTIYLSDYGGRFRVLRDNQCNTYALCNFSNYIVVAPGDTLKSKGASDAYVIKYNSNGQIIYKIQIGGSAADYGNDIALDKMGNLYVVGSFLSICEFGSNVALNNVYPIGLQQQLYDGFIAKYNATTGTCLWAKRGAGWYQDAITGIDIDNAGNIFLSGICSEAGLPLNGFEFYGTVYPMLQNMQGFVSRLSPDGNSLIWFQQMPASFFRHFCQDIVSDNKGNLYITGYSEVFSVGFLAKMTTSGLLKWNKNGSVSDCFGLPRQYFYQLVMCSDGRPAFSLYNECGSLIINNDTLANSQGNIILKADTAGNVLWYKMMKQNKFFSMPPAITGQWFPQLYAAPNGWVASTGMEVSQTVGQDSSILYNVYSANGNLIEKATYYNSQNIFFVPNALTAFISSPTRYGISVLGNYYANNFLPTGRDTLRFDAGLRYVTTGLQAGNILLNRKYAGCGSEPINILANQQTKRIGFNISPNPVNGGTLTLNITGKIIDNKNYSVIISDAGGQIRKEFVVSKPINTIIVSDLYKGMHYLLVKDMQGNKLYSAGFMIQ